MKRVPYFDVRPRYTCGSPGVVSEAQALHVAAQERHEIQVYLSGVYGVEAATRAEKLGLGPQPDVRGVRRGIAEEVTEHRDHWMIRDLLTGEVYSRLFDQSDSKIVRGCVACLAARERAVVDQIDAIAESADGSVVEQVLVDILVSVETNPTPSQEFFPALDEREPSSGASAVPDTSAVLDTFDADSSLTQEAAVPIAAGSALDSTPACSESLAPITASPASDSTPACSETLSISTDSTSSYSTPDSTPSCSDFSPASSDGL